ncbi:thiamine phosphate synthase [Thomasclavelia cocleata]|uniref:Thiamine-phosphate synthase n=1 Tax=Thomasclavelia cocleata TaxID=69824 RepID=A0A1I0FMM7_9FIRM|nr:thiamine phosphate synthase [Thomasclavelia cocleata]MCR1961056.1 thiamine phosphate synthase [Thomasclavelia cocleata]SET58539.1 thiamine-phosphate pyrophosphorylase [Thomasclavelia cocleata]
MFYKEMLKLYLVTDRKWLNGRKLTDDLEKAILGGVTTIQLREKNLSNEEFISIAKDVKKVCQKYHIPLIINDNLEVALATNSDGIHIGQNDIPASIVRKQIGPDKILGVSVHNLKEAFQAKIDGADYVGVGAIFSTETKNDATNVTLDSLKKICDNIDLPVVAIGGINLDNISKLKDINIAGIAVVSAIMKANDITAASGQLVRELNHD